MSLALEALSWILIVSGSLFCVTGALGLVRLRGFYTRTHAASLVDSAGAGLLLAGLLLQAGWTLVAVKLVMIGLLIFFTSPAATHALANAALARGLAPDAEGEGVPSKR
ncbi:MAG: sodium:proton antiporter [Betaproteobacteria bacterium]|nr:sodium:proton antiporter [Betaproteobacteria bacterium]MBM3355929.1 sodium:proton antiporter [Betaproteobacteria bacterium]MBM3383993.1 sodium:proton antiporter [Betaproteobacteria bacterium]